ncbi:G2/mitotic-specific cyclin S13-6 [Hibiscus syriacus]|uniref:G2/mitotic-specific cyclin S13-6 n=1 Tax=Hibiscus syriacus TaxID=106335 RepID=A0A6A2XR40_HIBSY|nr:G2/mitotic-specific cyclin S13-7-like isoform X2 [Hibiscus syriacus]KAE8658817.1 G2/mitotic-specific cyclin S13-6 [Hibiscus syriacus]
MASRPIVPQQARGDAGVGGAGAAVHKQTKKNAAPGDGRSRRALGDIGNVANFRGVVVEGKPQQQIQRPLTRSFCAQLLANAQAVAAAEKNKKNVCVNVEKAPVLDGVPKRGVAAAPKAVQRKPAAKPFPATAEVIEISPDVEEEVEVKEEKKKDKVEVKNNKKVTEGEKSSKKKQHTFSSALTARSKAAHGIANKPKEQIVLDIDEADANNHLAGVEYVEDIYKFYKSVENESRPNYYMHLQTDINEKMRAILIDWLIDVHQKFELSPEALYLTVNLIDRFLSVKVVPRKELQLLGMSAMLIATKYEEIWPPEVNDLVCIADRTFTHEQILLMEKTILRRLEWTLTVPTHYVFLARFIKASIPDLKMENMVYFLAELGIMHYETIRFCPSMVAASAVYAARCTLNKTPAWTDTLEFHTGYSEQQLVDYAKLLAYFQSKAAESRLQVVYKKYSSPLRGAVALFPPSKYLLSAESRVQVA